MTELPQGTILGTLQLVRVLEYYDFPRLFTCRSNTGQVYIGLSTFDDQSECHWLYVPVSSLRLSTVTSGKMPLRSAFLAPEGGYLLAVKTCAEMQAQVTHLLPEQIVEDDLPSPTYAVLAETEADDEQTVQSPTEVAESTRRETFDYHIYPGEPKTHEIPARKLGEILTTTQELLDALGQAATGKASVRGPISAELLQQTKVNVTHVFRGSFGVQFRSIHYSDFFDSSTVSEAIAEFTYLLLAADSEDLLSNKLHFLKGRVASKYRRLLKELTDLNSGLLLDWGAVNKAKGGQFSLSKEQIKRAYAIVDRIDIEMADEVTVSGKLVGFNSRTKRYEIRSTEDAKTYAGRVADDARIEVTNPSIGEFYKVKLRMLVETQSTSGDELIRWVLVGLGERLSTGT